MFSLYLIRNNFLRCRLYYIYLKFETTELIWSRCFRGVADYILLLLQVLVRYDSLFQEAALVRQIKDKTVEFIKAIIDTCIKLDFDYFLSIIWKQILPKIKTDAFNVYKKLYDSRKGGTNFVLELLNFCLSEGTHTLESFLKEIAPFIADNDSNTVHAICAAIKSKITDGFCWETIKDICKKAAPPVDMVEVVLLQCLKRKKNRNHILEVNEMIKTKMLAQERNNISGNLLKQFSELVQRNNPPQNDKEIMSTMPLNNVTNNLINGPR